MTIETADMEHFHSLSQDEKVRTLRDLASIGMGIHTISHACGLSVEIVRHLLADLGTA